MSVTDFFAPNPGNAFLNGATDVGYTDQDQPQNTSALPGPTNNLICDRTGFRVSVHDGLRLEWSGRMVRRQSWEPRHPQDYVRAIPDKLKGSPRPEPTDTWVGTVNPTDLS